ncbi:hypothetical protein ACVSUJ_06295, partial [Yersinia enterocolitica]
MQMWVSIKCDWHELLDDIGTRLLYGLILLEKVVGKSCSGQQKLATALEFFQNNLSDSFGVKPPLY